MTIMQLIFDTICNALIHFIFNFGHLSIKNPLPPSKMSSLSTNAAFFRFSLNDYNYNSLLLDINDTTLQNKNFFKNFHF